MAGNGSGADPDDVDLTVLLREVTGRVDEAARSAPARAADLRRRLVAATGAARHDAALARRRLLALAADLDRPAADRPSGDQPSD